MRESWRFSAVCLLVVAGLATAEDKYFDSNGVKLNYVIQGKGEPVVLLHGFGANLGLQWKVPGTIDKLAEDFQVIALNNRGHGLSEKPHDPSDYGVQMAEDVVRLLDHLKIPKAHVAGYSMGGWITVKLLATHPERLKSAAVCGSGWLQPDDPSMSSLIKTLSASLEAPGRGGFRPLIIELTPEGEGPMSEDRINTLNVFMSTFNDKKAMSACVRGMPGLAVTAEDLKKNKVPTLGLIGDKDPLRKRVFDPMMSAMSSVEAKIVGGNHFDSFLRPDFIAALREFLLAQKAKPAG